MYKAMRKINFAIVSGFILMLLSCGGKEPDGNLISVTIEPQRYFAEKIAGDRFTIHTVVPSGQSPETYDPTPRQMINIGKSIAYFQIGYIGFEQAWMQNIRENNPDMKVFDLSEGLELIINGEDHDNAHHDGHDHSGHHHHGGIDPHIWSSVSGARMIAWNILNAFITLDKENTRYYWENYNELMAEINETEARLVELISPLTNRAFIIYHPALTYFAGEFNLMQLCIEMDGKEPSTAQLSELVETAEKYNAHVVFIQKEFDRKNAELIARETGCRLVTINPLDYNWSEEMIRIGEALAGE